MRTTTAAFGVVLALFLMFGAFVISVGQPDGKVRLIKATVRQQAVAHVANTLLTVRVASQDDLVTALKAGIEIEQYRAPEQPELQEMIEYSESPAN